MQNEEFHSPEGLIPDGLPVIDYASPTLKSPLSVADWGAIALLAICTVIYGIACIPSYSRSSWPPIERFLEAPPWLWVFAVPMFTVIVPGGPLSRKALLIYALVTSGIDAGTLPFANMNPHHMGLDLWFANLIFAVPVHLGLTAIVALLSRLAYQMFGVAPSLEMRGQLGAVRWARIGILGGVTLIATLFPFTYERFTVAMDDAAGARLADADWANRNAVVIGSNMATYREEKGIGFQSFIDAASGFPLRHSWMRRWEPGYNAEICSLLKSRGIPTWSYYSRVVADSDMVSMLTAPDMREITSYPCVLSPNIVLFRGGGTTPWGSVVYSNSRYLDIECRNQDFIPLGTLGDEKDPAFVAQLSKYPKTFFIRCGKSVVACTSEGRIIQGVYEDP